MFLGPVTSTPCSPPPLPLFCLMLWGQVSQIGGGINYCRFIFKGKVNGCPQKKQKFLRRSFQFSFSFYYVFCLFRKAAVSFIIFFQGSLLQLSWRGEIISESLLASCLLQCRGGCRFQWHEDKNHVFMNIVLRKTGFPSLQWTLGRCLEIVMAQENGGGGGDSLAEGQS